MTRFNRNAFSEKKGNGRVEKNVSRGKICYPVVKSTFQGLKYMFQILERTFQSLECTFQSLEHKFPHVERKVTTKERNKYPL